MGLTLKNYTTTGEQIQHEVLRKSIHLLVALVPLLAAFNLFATMALLAGGTLLYTFAEMIRQKGRYVFIRSEEHTSELQSH